MTYIRLYEIYDLWKPWSNEPPDASYEANALEKTINWTLYDNNEGGNYNVLLNGSNYIENSWENGVNLAVPVNTESTLGDWNYTILYNDTSGLWGEQDIVIITIYEGSGPTDFDPPDSSIPGFKLMFEITILSILILIFFQQMFLKKRN